MLKSFWEMLKASFRGLRVHEEARLLVGQSILIGVIVWMAIFALKEIVHAVFHQVVHWIEHAPTLFVLFIPLVIGGLIVAFLGQYKAHVITYIDSEGEEEPLNAVEGDGVERTIALYYSSDPSVTQGMKTEASGIEARWQVPTFALGFRKFLATVATLGSGGSGGLEGSSVLIGETLAAGVYKFRNRIDPSERKEGGGTWFIPNSDHLQIAQISGVAAAVGVLLGTPLAAAFFATEVMYRNKPLLEKLFYALISALVARAISTYVKGYRPFLFKIDDPALPEVTLRYLLFLILMAIAIAFVGQVYRALSVEINTWFSQIVTNSYARLTIGALITGAIALAFTFYTREAGLTDRGLEYILGSGEPAIKFALNGEITMWLAFLALTAKMFATLATIGSGGSAGMLIPAMYFGTMVAAFFASFANMEAVTLVGPALAASLIALVNTPLAAILLAVELLGVDYMVPVLIAIITTSLFSNPKTLYRTQQDEPEEEEVVIEEITIPTAWQGQRLGDLKLAETYQIKVAGLLQTSSDGRAAVQVERIEDEILSANTVLVISAEAEVMERFLIKYREL